MHLEEFEKMINLASAHRSVPTSGRLNEKVKNVCVILTSSRGGSSFFKEYLSQYDDFIFLDGEEEPYYILSKNTLGFNSESDEIKTLQNKQYVLDCMFDELGVNSGFDLEKYIHDWSNRVMLQFPETFFKKLDELASHIRKVVQELNIRDGQVLSQDEFKELSVDILNAIFYAPSGFIYDIHPKDGAFHHFYKIEEPPFVVPKIKRKLTEADLEEKTLLFKTPQDCYRIGMFEQLFPNATIKYVHLTRGFAQTTNGLIDGWLSHSGFFAHNLKIIDVELNISGYSDQFQTGKYYWKFDLPPNWYSTKAIPLGEVCVNQWASSHEHILASGVDKLQIKFEEFLENPKEELERLSTFLGKSLEYTDYNPQVMTTHPPAQYRWRKNGQLIRKLGTQTRIQDLMHELHYKMDEHTWI